MASYSPPLTSESQKTEAGVAALRAGQGNEFFWRRLHSLTGIIPIGAFLIEHILASNSTAMNGPEAYANTVKFLGSLPLVLALETLFIWLPIAFHGLYGFYIWYRGDSNVGGAYPWTGNWMYTVQRWTGAHRRSSISAGTCGICALPASTCTRIRALPSAKFRANW